MSGSSVGGTSSSQQQLTLSKSFSTSLSSFIGETEEKIFGSDICRRCPRRRWFLGEELADPVTMAVPEVMPRRRCISILKIKTKITHAHYKVHTHCRLGKVFGNVAR